MVSHVNGTATPMTKTSWYADGVGLVKSTTEGGQIKYGWELVNYSFKKSHSDNLVASATAIALLRSHVHVRRQNR